MESSAGETRTTTTNKKPTESAEKISEKLKQALPFYYLQRLLNVTRSSPSNKEKKYEQPKIKYYKLGQLSIMAGGKKQGFTPVVIGGRILGESRREDD